MILRALVIGLLFTSASQAAYAGGPAAVTTYSTKTAGLEVLDDGLLLVRVTVNGSGPHLFLLDTGGSSTVVSDTLARQLGLISAGSHRIDTLSGSRTVGITRVDELRLGDRRDKGGRDGETFRGVEVLWMDLANLRARDSRIQGVIGQDLLRTRSVLLDYEARRLTFDPVTAPERQRLPLDWSDGRPVVRVVGHHTGRGRTDPGAGSAHTSAALRLVIDSGSTHVILFDHASTRSLVSALREAASATMTMTNHGGSRPVMTATVDRLELAEGNALCHVVAALVPMDPGQERIEDGLLPASLFRAIYFDNRAGEVVLKGGQARSLPASPDEY